MKNDVLFILCMSIVLLLPLGVAMTIIKVMGITTWWKIIGLYLVSFALFRAYQIAQNVLDILAKTKPPKAPR